jgi:hypothetical protein
VFIGDGGAVLIPVGITGALADPITPFMTIQKA